MSWSAAADRAAAAINRTFEVGAVYRHGGSGFGLPVAVVFTAATADAAFSGLRVQGPAFTAVLLQPALPVRPVQNDTLFVQDRRTLDFAGYSVNAAPEQDEDRTIWTLKLREGAVSPPPLLAVSVLRTLEGDAVADATMWDWDAGQSMALTNTSTICETIDLTHARLVLVQTDRPCWLKGGASAPTAVVNGAGMIRLDPGPGMRLVVEAGHRLAAVASDGVIGTLRIIPAR